MEQTSFFNPVSEKQVLDLISKYHILGKEEDINFMVSYITRDAIEENIPMAVIEEFFMRNEQKNVRALGRIETTPFKTKDRIEAINNALLHPIDKLLWVLTEEQLNRLFFKYYTIYEDKVYRLYR